MSDSQNISRDRFPRFRAAVEEAFNRRRNEGAPLILCRDCRHWRCIDEGDHGHCHKLAPGPIFVWIPQDADDSAVRLYWPPMAASESCGEAEAKPRKEPRP
jgi:hypothetical protein